MAKKRTLRDVITQTRYNTPGVNKGYMPNTTSDTKAAKEGLRKTKKSIGRVLGLNWN